MTSESIVVEGLTRRYGDVVALRGLSFEVRPGEIVGFLGPNGAGKSTTMKILTGYLSATEGEARVAGLSVREDSEAVREKIGYLPENVPLYEEMIVHDYLRFVAEIRGVARARRSDRIMEVGRLTGLTHMLGRTISELSKGYRQRVGLAQAIIHEPEVLILDEPTTGLDPNQIVEIRDVIKSIGQEKTIIFSTHILQEVTAVCDRIIIINRGELVADGTLEELEDRMSELRPGLIVGFDGEAGGELREFLEALPGVTEVTEVTGRVASFLVIADDDEEVRKALIEAEAESPRGLVELRRAEASLEAIFRLFTADTEGEEATEEESAAAEHEHEEEEEEEKESADG